MKLLFDENLSPKLAESLADIYPDSTHVHLCGLGSADDAAVWEYAGRNGYTIVSKDSDFQERSVLYGFPPKFLWLRAANCTSAVVENLLRAAQPTIIAFLQDDQESCLILSVRSN